MKRFGNLYNKICSFETLYLSYQKARRANPNNLATLKFAINLESNLFNLLNELISERYYPGKYRRFMIRDPKLREIWSAPFRDRVVHHAIYNVIEPIFDKTFIYDSYACRKGKGSHHAVERLSKFIQNPDNTFCLKCDISKYFDSVDHRILISLICRKIKDKKVINLICKIIASAGNRNVIPIGNLTSQLFANIYLNPLDYFVKHTLKVNYYIRYVDDFIILGHNTKELEILRQEIRDFLDRELKLNLHPKKAVIFPVKNGIDFLGFRIYKMHRKIRKSSMLRFKRKFKDLKLRYFKNRINLKDFISHIASYLGHWRWADTYRLRAKIFGYE